MADASPLTRLRHSFKHSFGEVVFGMEDGTVSIFGLVFGVAVSASSSDQVLLAGATGAIAAAVSMAAGVFLDRQSSQDQARIAHERHLTTAKSDPGAVIKPLLDRLRAAGFADATLVAMEGEVLARPEAVLALTESSGEAGIEDSVPHATWMFASNLFAGLTPALPFAVLPLAEARVASTALTLGLLVLLGVARARIGERSLLPTVLQTVGIAAAAAAAGVIVAQLLT